MDHIELAKLSHRTHLTNRPGQGVPVSGHTATVNGLREVNSWSQQLRRDLTKGAETNQHSYRSTDLCQPNGSTELGK